MQRFFEDFQCLDRFTLSLACFGEAVQCPHCSKSAHLVSHGVIYKQRSIARREAVGKRVLCSNRFSHAGCGRTVQLYVAQAIPCLRYGAAELFIFLSCLLAKYSVQGAYQAATGQSQSRQGWRWLNRIMRNLTDFRCFLTDRLGRFTATFEHRCWRLKLLLATLERLFLNLPDEPVPAYQLLSQRAFI